MEEEVEEEEKGIKTLRRENKIVEEGILKSEKGKNVVVVVYSFTISEQTKRALKCI